VGALANDDAARRLKSLKNNQSSIDPTDSVQPAFGAGLLAMC
jgi:hypothetical protein